MVKFFSEILYLTLSSRSVSGYRIMGAFLEEKANEYSPVVVVIR